MEGEITPAYVRQLRHLFEQAIGLAPEARPAFLAWSKVGQEGMQQDAEVLLALATHAEAIMHRLGSAPPPKAPPWARVVHVLAVLQAAPVPTPAFEGLPEEGLVYERVSRVLNAYAQAPEAFEAAPKDDPFETAPPRAAPAGAPPSGNADSLIGATISHYQVQERLGRGGMGVVYKALDTRLGRTVALKFLPQYQHADADAQARFVHEARAASALDDPHLAVVHEIDRDEYGRLFIVMAYYAGKTLRDRIRAGALPVDEALGYALQMARGLQRAHEEGIVHRDIKPENVMLTERGQVKIVDFGLAKVQDVHLTVGGATLGTLAYMSPEQAFGGLVDHRADLWALGVVLYEMLSGRHPFLTSGGTLLHALANQEPDDLRAQRPEVPERIGWLLTSLIEKDPARRYQRTADVVADLEAALQTVGGGNVTQATAGPLPMPAPAGQEAMVRPRRPPVRLVGGVALGLLVLLVGVAWLVWGDADAPGVDAAGAQAAVEEGISLLAAGASDGARDAFRRAVALDSTYAPAWDALAAFYIMAGEYSTALPHARRAVNLDATSALASYNLGFVLEETGALDEARTYYARATQLDPAFLEAYSALGSLHITRAQPEEALQVLAQGAAAAPESENLFLIYKNMGRAHLAMGNAAQAVETLEQAYALKAEWAETIALLAEAYEASGARARSRLMWERYVEVERDPDKQQRARDRLREG